MPKVTTHNPSARPLGKRRVWASKARSCQRALRAFALEWCKELCAAPPVE